MLPRSPRSRSLPQVTFVEACVALDRLKPAARGVRQLGLAAEFPNVESTYRQRSLARLVSKRLWQVALSFVGSDAALQVRHCCPLQPSLARARACMRGHAASPVDAQAAAATLVLAVRCARAGAAGA